MRRPRDGGGAAKGADDGKKLSRVLAPPPRARKRPFCRLGDIAAEIVGDLRFRRQVERLHSLGPRAVGELLAEIGEQRACRAFIDRRLAAYAALDPKVVRELDGDQFPRPPLYPVKI